MSGSVRRKSFLKPKFMKKLWFVSREVYTESAEKAGKERGTVYRIELAPDNLQPEFRNLKHH